jgi:hypothetical protein
MKDQTEIIIDPTKETFDLSSLDEKELEFWVNFVGTFDPGPNFQEEDIECRYNPDRWEISINKP